MKYIFLIIFFKLFILINSYALENKIVLKIENEIITSLDIENEIRYLQALNPNIIGLEKKRLNIIAKNSLIREKIKENEILKYVESIKLNKGFLDTLIKQRYTRLNLNNDKEFLNYLKDYQVDLNVIEEKISIEAVWNQLVYQKFSSKIKIDKKKLEEQIEKSFAQGEKNYLLSEIVFKINKSENLQDLYSKIKKSILKDGFESSALTYSISESSQFGGKLGWIKESSLNNTINKYLLEIQKNEITNPILTPNGYIILKINDIKYLKKKYDKQKEIEELVRTTTNQQLNQFSNIYFAKVKKNLTINEY